jgi:hypothetical protein
MFCFEYCVPTCALVYCGILEELETGNGVRKRVEMLLSHAFRDGLTDCDTHWAIRDGDGKRSENHLAIDGHNRNATGQT